MSNKIKLKECYELENEFKAFYTGGAVAWTLDGKELLCQNSGNVNLVSINDINKAVSFGEVNKEDEISEDVIYTFALSPDGKSIVTAHRSGLLKVWDKDSREVKKMWKAVHTGPVARLIFNASNELIASGGTDTFIRIWDFNKQICLGSLRGCLGVINVIMFHPDPEKKIIVGAGDDAKILAWNYETREVLKTFSGHFSKVTAIAFSNDHEHIVSAGRDKVLILWNFETQVPVKTIPVYEGIESIFVLPKKLKLKGQKLKSDKIYVACAGELGIVSVWEMTETKIIFKQNNSLVTKAAEEGGLAITNMLFNKETAQLALVSADHNIIIHDINTFECEKQLTGFSDEILDIVTLGENNRYLAMATNSNDIKIYDTTTMNCQLIKGHTDIVLSLSANNKNLLSSSKDNSIRLWSVDFEKFSVKCVAMGLKHTNAVGSVDLSKVSGKFCVSVSQDRCLKLWRIPKEFNEEAASDKDLTRLNCTLTELAHEKDINCVCISPNDRLIATGSQDKTAKLWDANDLSLVGVFRGHKRGIWSVRFSPVDQILLTNAADCCIKLWSLTDMTCLKTLEGHESSVLRVEFLSNGMQLLSAGADGLLKVWSIKTSECIQTLDKHESRIWAICVSDDESTFYSGGSDSMLLKWKDVTDEKKLREMNERKEIMLQEQQLSNLINEKKLLKALRLALNLDRPLMTLRIINTVIRTQEQGLDETVKKLKNMHKETLLNHAITWNTNSRNCRPAQLVINMLMQEILVGNFKVTEFSKTLEASLPYTERHFKRMTEYMKDLKFVEFTLKCMQPHGKLESEDDDKNKIP